MKEKNVCALTEHNPVWAGDGYFCSKCMTEFSFRNIEKYNECGKSRHHTIECGNCRKVILNHLFVILLLKWQKNSAETL